MNYIIIIILISFSGLFSGLTLGLMGLNSQELKRKASLKDKNAKKIYQIRKKGNLLLTTLLIGNVAVNTALSIFLGSMAPGVIAGLIATSLIVVIGEIAPQATFSRFALTLGAKFVWLVKIFIFILFPIAWPIAWVLDKILGEELGTTYSKRELIKIIEEHEDSPLSDVGEEEERIVRGALTFSAKKVSDIMTPRAAIVAYDSNEKINEKFIKSIVNSEHSRFPVYDDKLDSIVGILFLKDLVGHKNLNKLVKSVADKNVLFVSENKNLGKIFDAFLKTRQHLFVVIDEFGSVVGVVTIEDVLEEIIQTEIMDEWDKHKDLRKLAKKLAKKKQGQGIAT